MLLLLLLCSVINVIIYSISGHQIHSAKYIHIQLKKGAFKIVLHQRTNSRASKDDEPPGLMSGTYIFLNKKNKTMFFLSCAAALYAFDSPPLKKKKEKKKSGSFIVLFIYFLTRCNAKESYR